MNDSLTLLVLSVVCAGCSARQEFFNEDPTIDELNVALQKRLDELHHQHAVADDGRLMFPGVSVAVRLPGGETVSLVTGYADWEAKTPLLANHRFASGSVGKVAAGALATRLIVDGRLDPDQKIERWFHREPWFADLPNHNDITIRHLLQHSSGLGSYYENEAWMSRTRVLSDPAIPGHDPDAYLDFGSLMSYVVQDPLFPVAAKASYSENGYLLIGAVLGRVLAGDDQADEGRFREAYYRGLDELIFKPLNMENTTPFVGREHANLSQAYIAEHPAVASTVTKVLDEAGKMVFSPTSEFSGGGLVTNPADMTKLLDGVLAGRVFADAAAQDRFATVLRTPGPGNYGFGPFFDVSPFGPVIGHEGQFPGYRSVVFWLQDYDFTIALQVNSWRPTELTPWLAELAPIVIEYITKHTRASRLES